MGITVLIVLREEDNRRKVRGKCVTERSKPAAPLHRDDHPSIGAKKNKAR